MKNSSEIITRETYEFTYIHQIWAAYNNIYTPKEKGKKSPTTPTTIRPVETETVNAIVVCWMCQHIGPKMPYKIWPKHTKKTITKQLQEFISSYLQCNNCIEFSNAINQVRMRNFMNIYIDIIHGKSGRVRTPNNTLSIYIMCRWVSYTADCRSFFEQCRLSNGKFEDLQAANTQQ